VQADRALAQRLSKANLIDTASLTRYLAEIDGLRRQGRSLTLASYLAEQGVLDPRLLQAHVEATGSSSRGTGRKTIHRPRSGFGAGDRVFGCTVVKELGRGGMGAVYLATDETGREVALKVMLDPGKGERHKERFRREAAAYRDLGHPGIVKLLAADTEGDAPCMVMEFVRGRDLEAAFDEGDLSLDQRLEILEAVCRAVHAAHEAGILHRDLKPANVLLDGEHRPKVTDFGLVRDVTRETRLTKTGTTLGTPGYMSPEQVMGSKDVTGATDIFSLGVILYEAIAGERPFQGDTAIQLIAAIAKAEPERPSAHNPDLGPRHDAVCLKAMRKAPAERYATAAELADAIATLCTAGRGRIDLRRHVLRPLAVLVALALVGGGAYAWSERPPEPLSAKELRSQANELNTAARKLLVGSQGSIVDDEEKILDLLAEMTALAARSDGAAKPLERVNRRVRAIFGIYNLARGKPEEAAADLAFCGEDDSPEVRALRGGVAALSDGDPEAAVKDLTRAFGRGIKRLEVRAWRASAYGRTGSLAPRDAEQALADLTAIEDRRPLGPKEAKVRVRALALADRAREAEQHLARLSDPSPGVRWEVALAYLPGETEKAPPAALARVLALPAQAEPDPRRKPLGEDALRSAELLLETRRGQPMAKDVVAQVVTLARLGTSLWPAPAPSGLRRLMIERATSVDKTQGYVPIAEVLLEMFPQDLEVLTEVGVHTKRVTANKDKRMCLVALRQAIELEPERTIRSEHQFLLCGTLGFMNDRFGDFLLEECEEILVLAERLTSIFEGRERAAVLAARAVALRRLGDYEGAWRDGNEAIDLDGNQPYYHYTRMHVAIALGRKTQALADAVHYSEAAVDNSEKNGRAMATAWDIVLETGQFDLAVRAITKRLGWAPRLCGWWARLAYAQLQTDDLEAARVSMAQAHKWYVSPRAKLVKYYDKPDDLAAVRRLEAAVKETGKAALPELRAWIDSLDTRRRANKRPLP
jgi:predicted Ser/Thr protein kinase/tetratricopeptide (TPR) repeat protein